ncbi:hypothetical protein E1200_29780 [Actinomadura sp. GC306]|nr:hypothetical protein E1200_29780 [Actinomadura sp. GC306]
MVLAAVVQPVVGAGQAVDRRQGAVQDHERLALGDPHRLAQIGGPVGRQRMAAGQGELDLGLEVSSDEAPPGSGGGGPLPITSLRMGHLWAPSS